MEGREFRKVDHSKMPGIVKKKYAVMIPGIVMLLIIGSVVYRWEFLSLKLELSLNWHADILPMHGAVLFEENDHYFGDDGVSYVVLQVKDDVHLKNAGISETYSDRYSQYFVKRRFCLTDEQYDKICESLEWLQEIPEEYLVQQDEVSYCIEIERWFRGEIRDAVLYIMQDCSTNRMYIFEFSI